MGYERHEAMIAPARAGAAVWRTTLGVGLTAAVYAFALIQFIGLLSALDASDELYAGFYYTDTPVGTLLALSTFAFLAAGPLIACRLLHFRRWQTLIGPSGQATWDFLLAARAVVILAAVLWLLIPVPYVLEPGLAPGRWLALLPLTTLAIFVQTGAEELVFRGYLQTQLAARFRSPLVWMLLPSALFALGHYSPDTYGANAPWIVALTFAFGLAAADLTARTGSLGAAMGFHFANNMVAMAFISFPGAFSGLALYLLPFGADEVGAVWPLLWSEFAAVGLSWLAIRVALRV
jgi:membrane protease YdiL (CAAX protease family)